MHTNTFFPEPKVRPIRRLDLVKVKLMCEVALRRKSPADALKEYYQEKRREEHLAETKTELICDVVSMRKKPLEAIRAYKQEKRKTLKPSNTGGSAEL